MAWTTPKTWSNLDPLVASEFNTQFRDNLNDLDSRVDSNSGKLGRSYANPLLHRAVIGINQAVSITIPYQSTAVMTWHSKCKLTFTPKTDLALIGVQYSIQLGGANSIRRSVMFGLRMGSSDISLDTTDVVGSALASVSDFAVRSLEGGDFNWIEYRAPVAVTRGTEVTIAPTVNGGGGQSSSLSLRNPSVMILTALDVGAYE